MAKRKKKDANTVAGINNERNVRGATKGIACSFGFNKTLMW